MKDLRLYILMRNDLASMGPGRAAAQASHASNAFVHTFGHRSDVKEWQRQTKQGFGTAIVLSSTMRQIEELFNELDLNRVRIKDQVIDLDYCITVNEEIADLLQQNYDAKFCNFTLNYPVPSNGSVIVSREEVTCAYVFGEKEQLVEYLGNLPLYG